MWLGRFDQTAREKRGQALNSAEESVTLREAAAIGGYSVDALQRMVASGRIANVGRKGRPRIRRVDIPVKPGYRGGNLLDGPAGASVRPTAVVAAVIRRHSIIEPNPWFVPRDGSLLPSVIAASSLH